MNWDDMRLFLGLARNGRVAIAAKGLKVDPTTLIRRVKKNWKTRLTVNSLS